MLDATMAMSDAAPVTRRTRGPVLVVGGRASAEHLLDLGRWTGAGDDTLNILVPGERTAERGADAVQRLVDSDAGGVWPLQSRRLLDAIAETGAASVVLGYPADAEGRADFALAVQRMRAEVDVDVIVYFERHRRPWQRILVPYLSAALDRPALRLAQRSQLDVTLLHAVESDAHTDAAAIRSATTDCVGCTLRVVQTNDPLSAAAEEAQRGYELVMLGGGQGLRGRPFTMRQQRLLLGTDVSLAFVHSAG